MRKDYRCLDCTYFLPRYTHEIDGTTYIYGICKRIAGYFVRHDYPACPRGKRGRKGFSSLAYYVSTCLNLQN